jgi:hypothetical protein
MATRMARAIKAGLFMRNSTSQKLRSDDCRVGAGVANGAVRNERASALSPYFSLAIHQQEILGMVGFLRVWKPSVQPI